MNKVIDSADLKQFEKMLDESSRIVLTCHVRPDGDAVGSTLGLYHLLKTLGKNVVVVTPDQPPRSLSFLPGFKEIAVFTRHDPYCQRVIDEADLIICCDFNKLSRQDQLGPVIGNASARKVLIDHHQQPDNFCDVQFSFPEMSSTCELVFRLIAALGLYNDVNLDSATSLLTGMITDTRNFSVNCNSGDIYEIMNYLLDKGCDKTRIVHQALMSKSYGALKLHAYAISNKMEIFEKHRASIITLDREELKRFHYERGDCEGLVNVPLEIRGVAYSFFLREDPDCIKVSARSINDFPVSIICEELFGGGGHIMAAGGEFKGSLTECRKLLVDHLSDYDKFLKGKFERLEIYDIQPYTSERGGPADSHTN